MRADKKYLPLVKTIPMGLNVFMWSITPCFSEFIPATDNNIIYHGRFDFTIPTAPAFNWSGSGISTSFTGTRIAIKLEDGFCNYDVTIDDRQFSVLITQHGIFTYLLAQDLGPGVHTIKIYRRSEEHYHKAIFKGFILQPGSRLKPPSKTPDVLIEFIGDSYTAGYGNESLSPDCDEAQIRASTNTNKSFGPLVAKELGADFTMLGWSGKGMVRNYGASQQTSPDPYPRIYQNTLGALYSPWDFTQRVPQLVVICLGTNDFSTEPAPTENVYKSAYLAFIQILKTRYPMAKILCVATHVGKNPEYVKKIVNEGQTKFPDDLYYTEFPERGISFNGCHYHPNLADDRLIAKTLVNAIASIKNWRQSKTSMIKTIKKENLIE